MKSIRPLFVYPAIVASSIFAGSVLAGPDCTSEPVEKWKDQDTFKEELKAQGYSWKVFKVTSGNCYEIYGWNSEGKKVEIYFDPITGEKVKEEVKG